MEQPSIFCVQTSILFSDFAFFLLVHVVEVCFVPCFPYCWWRSTTAFLIFLDESWYHLINAIFIFCLQSRRERGERSLWAYLIDSALSLAWRLPVKKIRPTAQVNLSHTLLHLVWAPIAQYQVSRLLWSWAGDTNACVKPNELVELNLILH